MFALAPILRKVELECAKLREIYAEKHDAYFQDMKDFLLEAEKKLENFDAIETSTLSKTNGISLPSRKSKIRKVKRVTVSAHRKTSTRLSAVSLKAKHSISREKSLRSSVANSSSNSEQFVTPEQVPKQKVKTPETLKKQSPQVDAIPHTPDVLNISKKQSLRSAVLTANSKKSINIVQPTISPAETSYTSYEISQLRESDDSEDDDATHKPIPKWATGIHLKDALLNQHFNCPKTELLEQTDTHIEPYEMFGIKKERGVHRSSSAIWDTPDRNMY